MGQNARWRFDPPRWPFSPELRWVVAAAFGTADADGVGPFDQARALSLAGRLDLLPRITARVSRQQLALALGDEAALDCKRQRAASVARTLQLKAVVQELAEQCTELGMEVAFLKFAGLAFGGWIQEGSRLASDVDLLVAPGLGSGLQESLLASGYRSSGHREKEHQLAPIFHPSGVAVEVHRKVLGVRLAPEPSSSPQGKNAESADLASLASAGLLAPCADLPAGAWIPTSDLLAAHALVHGLVQHGYAPDSYPLLRMVADLIDLGFGEGPGLQVMDRVQPWISQVLASEEVEACRELCFLLGTGRAEALDRPPTHSGCTRLFHHLIAGSLDEGYQRSLRMKVVTDPLSDHPRHGAALRWGWNTLFPSRAEIDQIYGRPKHELGYWVRWGTRPFDLLLRTVRSLRSGTGRRQE